MQVEDGMVSRLLSLRFHAFGPDDRRALERNVDHGFLKEVVSEAARIYLESAIKRQEVDLYRLEDIRDWLKRNTRVYDREVVARYDETISALHRGEDIFHHAGPQYASAVPRF